MQRLNTTEWDNHYNNWRASNMSISAYCKSTGINYQRLCYWHQVKEGTKTRQKLAILTLPNHFRFLGVSLPQAVFLFTFSLTLSLILVQVEAAISI